MAAQRPPYGLAIAALGAVLLAVSVFLPWYGISLTAAGAAVAQQVDNQVATQFGNAALQSYMSTATAGLGALAGHQFTAVSAHQILHDLNVLLLGAAGLAIVLALAGLATGQDGRAEGLRPPLALVGAVAALCVLYRMVDPPSVPGGILALSLREGTWLALLGSLGIVAGALWPAGRPSGGASQAQVHDALASLSGWTPQA